MGTGVSLTLLPTLETLFILLDCFVQPHYEGFQLVLLYLVFFFYLFFPVWLSSLEYLYFSGERGRCGAELEGMERG